MSKLEIAKRIGAATKVAFTHGYSDEEFIMGLHTSSFLQEVEDASIELARRHNENITERSFLVNSIEQVHNKIENILSSSRATWLSYVHESGMGHMVGVLKLGENKYLTWNTEDLKRTNSVDSLSIAKLIVANHGNPKLKVHIFGFSK